MSKGDKRLVLENNIEMLKTNIKDIENNLDFNITDLMSSNNDFLPDLNLDIVSYNYDEEMDKIKEETSETLNCISSLYLDEVIKNDRNISNIIKNDAKALSDIKFSLSCSKRGLINCMKQIDAGSNDPLMHQAVNSYQKEIRDSNKMVYDLLNKMKDFYKSLRDELKTDDIKTEEKHVDDEQDNMTIMTNEMLNNTIEEYMKRKKPEIN